MENQVVEYNVTDAAIAEMEQRYMGLVVKGLDDKKGLSEVHAARMIVRGKRIEVEKKRKELKADALKWSQLVDSEARRITKKLEPIEEHLTIEEEKITKEKERIRKEAERKKQAEAQGRVDALSAYGVSLPFAQALVIEQPEFEEMLSKAKSNYEAEQARLAEEARKEHERREAERKAREEEAARLAAERVELERIRAKEAKKRAEEEARMKAELDKIEAERRAVEQARREQEHREAVARAEKEAAERAEREAKKRIEREVAAKVEAERKAKEEAERQEALRPDKEKLLAFAAAIVALPSPGCFEPAAVAIVDEATKRIIAINRYIIKAANEL